MKLYESPKSGWLWLSLSCFGLLVCLISIEVGLFYPQFQRYFDNTGSLTAQPLASRSRHYLLNSIELLARSTDTAASHDNIRQNMDLAYALLDINLYVKRYPCTAPSLEQIDRLERQFHQNPSIDFQQFTSMLLPVLKCTDLIDDGQNSMRSTLATEMAANHLFHRRVLLWGTLLMIAAGFVFWALHMKQCRIISRNKSETNKWIQHAMRDALTGALNRRAFDIDFADYLERYHEQGNVFSILMCDIDYFKQYNDTLGHIEGDRALQYVTQALATVLREDDKLYRYGGEEIVIILDNTDKTQAKNIGLRALEQIRKLRLPHPTAQLEYLTVSIGAATTSERENTTEKLIALADKRLYAAKQDGRNCLIQ